MRARLAGLAIAAIAASSSADPPHLAPAPVLDPSPWASIYAAELSWPLSRPPGTGPHVDVLAWYDVAADEVCGAKPSRTPPEHIAVYVAAWCAPAETRVAALVTLLDGENEAMRAAIRADVIDALAETDDGSAARAWLVAHKLDTNDMLEALAAADLALGKPATWYRALFRECHRFGLALRAGNQDENWGKLLGIEAVKSPLHCGGVWTAIECPLATGATPGSWGDERDLASVVEGEMSTCNLTGLLDRENALTVSRLYTARLAARWPSPSADVLRWLAYARVAVHASRWGPNLEHLAVAALANALITGSCAPVVVNEVRALARERGLDVVDRCR
jgi:hypothetical protein